MNTALTRPRPALLTGILLALPFTLIFAIARFNIEPLNRFTENVLKTDSERMHVAGLVFILGTLALLPVAFAINLSAVLRSLRAGNTIIAHPANFILTFGLLIYIVTLLGSFVVDQYPCWVGMPNCD